MPAASADSDSSLLGGLSRRAFLRRHWQKRPLLVRQAFDRSSVRLIDKRGLFSLAGRDDVEARLVERRGAISSRLESCLLAMQNVRFDLLRMRSAGVNETLGDLTQATQQAKALSRDVDAAISAAGEVRRLTRN